MSEMKIKSRDEIEESDKWDLSQLCRDDSDFYNKLNLAKDMLPQLKAYEGKLDNKQSIYEYLMLDKKLEEILEPIRQYSFLKLTEDLSSENYNEMHEKLSLVLNEMSIDTSFATSELYQLSDQILDEIIADEKFKDYDKSFKSIKKNKIHKLSKEEEKLLAGMDFLGGFSDNMEKASDVDFDFGEIESSSGEKYKLTTSKYGKFMRDSDRKLRQEAFCKLNGKYGQLINMLANNYINDVKATCYFAKVRKFNSAIESALEMEEVESKVYYKLIEKVSSNLPLLFDYFNLKKKDMKLEDFYIYDTMASIEKGKSKTYTYDEAFELIKRALAPLGEEYLSLLDRAKNERWIDVYPNLNKRSGAFESSIYGYHPYVMTNFEGDIDSVFTLAHELGHAMHSYFSDKNQPYEKAYYTIFLAEIASTTNEILLINYLIANSKNSDEKKALYNKLFDEVKGTIFRQTMFAEFEERVHSMHEQGEGLTKDKLCNEYYQLNKKYFGDVRLVDEVKYEWARIPHFFNSFYVYKYATGMICAINFANKILSKEENALENYYKFLSAGCSDDPITILKNSDCDLTNAKTFDSSFDFLKDVFKSWQKL